MLDKKSSMNELIKVRQEMLPILQTMGGAKKVIAAVYLFGSVCSGLHTGESDIDLAFLLDEKAHKADAFSASAPAHLVAARLGERLNRNTDVIILNAASIEIAYEVIATGICIYDTNMEKRMTFECAMRGMYYDFRPFLEELRLRRINAL